jgi:ferritin
MAALVVMAIVQPRFAMRISVNIENLLNEQISLELYSMNLYLSMASYFNDQELTGFANFFRVQSAEENQHAQKQFDYLHNVSGRLKLHPIDSPPHDFQSPLHIFEQTLAHEKQVSGSINRLVEAALGEKDYATHNFLQWFVTEQVEEEATMQNILSKLKRIGDNASALYLLDEELQRRRPAVSVA